MSRKILVISSSPRRGGNSDSLCDEFIRGAVESGNDVEKISLRDKRVGYCLACGNCYRRGKPCPQKDDAAVILQKMIDADTIVMATPVYFYTMCAQMKTLIDRTVPRYTEISGKQFYFIMAAADGNPHAMDRVMEEFRGFLACLNGPEEVGVIRGNGAWNIGDIDGNPALREAYNAGLSIN